MFGALIPTLVKFHGSFDPFIAYKGVTTCSIKSPDDNCNMGNFSSSVPHVNDYEACDCTDTCGFNAPDNAPFRKGSNLQAWLLRDKVDNVVWSEDFATLYTTNLIAVAAIILHGIFSLLEIQWTQADVRDSVFHFLAGRGPWSQRGFLSRGRYYSGKTIAIAVYSTALLVAIISPFVFISSVIMNELFAWVWPSEDLDVVGEVRGGRRCLLISILYLLMTLLVGTMGRNRVCHHCSPCSSTLGDATSSPLALLQRTFLLAVAFTYITSKHTPQHASANPRCLHRMYEPFHEILQAHHSRAERLLALG